MIITNIAMGEWGVELMIKKNIIQTITSKQMDRKDFLKYSGLAVVAAVGLKTVVNLITQADDHKSTASEASKQSGHGFGSGKYGA